MDEKLKQIIAARRAAGDLGWDIPENVTEVMLDAALRESGEDAARLDFLDANPKLIIRSGKQRIRPLIDIAMANAARESA